MYKSIHSYIVSQLMIMHYVANTTIVATVLCWNYKARIYHSIMLAFCKQMINKHTDFSLFSKGD